MTRTRWLILFLLVLLCAGRAAFLARMKQIDETMAALEPTPTEDSPELRQQKELWSRLYEKRIESIQRVGRRGGRASFQHDGTLSVHFIQGQNITEEELAWLTEWPQLSALRVSYPAWKPDGLAILSEMTKLETLALPLRYTTDEHITAIGTLTNLRQVDLSRSRISDAGLVYLKPLAKLQWLCLDETSITDGGLEHLSGLTNLRELWLENTDVTDAGLIHLQGLPKLQKLYVWGVQNHRRGGQKLRDILRGLSVLYHQCNANLTPQHSRRVAKP